MNRLNGFAAVRAYGQVEISSRIDSANPHELIGMLFDGAIDRINVAKGQIERKQTADKCASLSKAINIIEGLRLCLDKEKGGEVAKNLEDLYEYMSKQLLRANAGDRVELLDEVINLLARVRDGWSHIPEDQIKKLDERQQTMVNAG